MAVCPRYQRDIPAVMSKDVDAHKQHVASVKDFHLKASNDTVYAIVYK